MNSSSDLLNLENLYSFLKNTLKIEAILIGTRKKNYRAGQYFLLITLAIYFLAVIHLVFFPIEVYVAEYNSTKPLWKVILQEIEFIPILTIDIQTFVLNVIMLIPFGVYLPLLVRTAVV